MGGLNTSAQEAADKAAKASRRAEKVRQFQQRLDQAKQQPLSWAPKLKQSLFAMMGVLIGSAEAAQPLEVAHLSIAESGVYELSIADLSDAGVNLVGVQFSRLALSQLGHAVPIEVLDDGEAGVFLVVCGDFCFC